MATIRQRANGTFELRVVHRSLPKPYYATLDSREDAERYAAKLKRALDAGQVPPELAGEPGKKDVPLSVMLRDYLNRGRVSPSDRPTVCWLQEQLDTTVLGVDVRWTDDWIRRMKSEDHLAPGTIRKKVESLARAIEWWTRDTGEKHMNPLRTLPVGYSRYAEGEAPKGKDVKHDIKRDRRLAPGEEERIVAAILGEKRPDRQRALNMPDSEDFAFLFKLILSTGLRLREAYTLTWGQVRLDLRTIHIAKSKTGRARDVPIIPSLYGGFFKSRSGSPRDPSTTIFRFWNGENSDLEPATRRLSARFKSTFKYAGCEDLTEHDLRHEATCRWMEMKDEQGRWLFRPEEVRRITGHLNVQMFERYVSMRGSDLAERLWDGHQRAAPL